MNEEFEKNEPLSPKAPEAESTPPAPQSSVGERVAASVFDYTEMLAWAVLAVLLLFMLVVRICRVDGESMEDTLHNGENLLVYSLTYTPQQDDIVVFHLTGGRESTQKTYVKRVIAVGGQEVIVNTRDNTITVDGVEYADSHSVLKDPDGVYSTSLFTYGMSNGIFKVTVPEGKVFVMGDNRNNSKDSRNREIGFVDERCILGKVVFRSSPLTVFS